MATLKNRGGGPFGWLRTQLGLYRGDANLRASSGTRRRRRESLPGTKENIARQRAKAAASRRSGSGTRKSKSK